MSNVSKLRTKYQVQVKEDNKLNNVSQMTVQLYETEKCFVIFYVYWWVEYLLST